MDEFGARARRTSEHMPRSGGPEAMGRGMRGAWPGGGDGASRLSTPVAGQPCQVPSLSVRPLLRGGLDGLPAPPGALLRRERMFSWAWPRVGGSLWALPVPLRVPGCSRRDPFALAAPTHWTLTCNRVSQGLGEGWGAVLGRTDVRRLGAAGCPWDNLPVTGAVGGGHRGPGARLCVVGVLAWAHGCSRLG